MLTGKIVVALHRTATFLVFLFLFSFTVTSVRSSAVMSPSPVPTPTRAHASRSAVLLSCPVRPANCSPTTEPTRRSKASWFCRRGQHLHYIYTFGGPSAAADFQTRPADPDPASASAAACHILCLSPSISSSCSAG